MKWTITLLHKDTKAVIERKEYPSRAAAASALPKITNIVRDQVNSAYLIIK